MNASQFSAILKNPLESGKTSDWDALIQQYPYAASLYLLKLFSCEANHPEYDGILHAAAARTLSRGRLQFLLEGPPVLEAEWLKENILPAEPVETEEFSISDESTEMMDEEAEKMPPPPEIPAASSVEFGFSFVRVKAGSKKKEAEAKPAAGEKGKAREKKTRQQDLMDRFIEDEPLLQPRIDFSNGSRQPDLARNSGKLKEEIISESMAMILIRQKKFPEAIKTLNKLSLKFPEKSAYFAALIKNLENQNPT